MTARAAKGRRESNEWRRWPEWSWGFRPFVGTVTPDPEEWRIAFGHAPFRFPRDKRRRFVRAIGEAKVRRVEIAARHYQVTRDTPEHARRERAELRALSRLRRALSAIDPVTASVADLEDVLPEVVRRVDEHLRIGTSLRLAHRPKKLALAHFKARVLTIVRRRSIAADLLLLALESIDGRRPVDPLRSTRRSRPRPRIPVDQRVPRVVCDPLRDIVRE